MESKCLNCKYFKLEDIFKGRCRIDKDRVEKEKLPIMKHDDICDRWRDAGQQYHIRAGWIKSVKKKAAESGNDIQ